LVGTINNEADVAGILKQEMNIELSFLQLITTLGEIGNLGTFSIQPSKQALKCGKYFNDHNFKLLSLIEAYTFTLSFNLKQLS